MAEQPQVQSYEFGRIRIDGRTYTADVVVLPTGVVSDWWRQEGHRLKPADLSAVLENPPQVLVVGQGAYGCMSVAQETLACLRQAGIEPLCAPTAEAVRIYTARCRAGRTVAAALHLTC